MPLGGGMEIRMEFQDFEEKKRSSEEIFNGRVTHLVRDIVSLPSGKDAVREVVRHVGAVCVVPLTDEGEVICVRQFRYPHYEVLTEIPAGKLDAKDEIPSEAALRELREETGVKCRKLTPLGKLYSSPAIFDEVIHMFLAEGLTYGETDPDEDECLEIVRYPLDGLVQMILDGKIPDAKTQAAVMRVYEMKRREKESC